MGTLIRKELRSLRPFALLAIFFGGLDTVYYAITSHPDRYSLSQLLDPELRLQQQVLLFLMAMAASSGLLVKERDEGTLDFLDGLPVTRARLFAAKTLAGLVVLWLLPLVETVGKAMLHALSRTSLVSEFPWGLFGTLALLDMAQCLVWFSVGLALSFLRRFAMLVLAVVFLACVAAWRLGWLWVDWLNVFALGQPVFSGTSWVLPSERLGVLLAVAAVCLGMAMALFAWLGDGSQRWAAALGRYGVTRWVLRSAPIAAGVVWLGLLGWWLERDSDGSEEPSAPAWGLSRARTDRFDFVFPEQRGERARALIAEADDIDRAVRGFLGVDPPGGRIAADLTGVARHAGTAYWRKVRMGLTDTDDPRELASTLGHELTHVYIDLLSENRMSEAFETTRAFHEGLATYVHLRFFSTPESRDAMRRVAAVARLRDHARIEELVNDPRLRRVRDPDLVYPLGEALVGAVVEAYGDAAPGRVLRAMARADAPKGLTGEVLWQDTFQAAGYDWQRVVDGFYMGLDRFSVEHRAFVDRLPRLNGVVERGEETIRLSVRYEGEPPGSLVCRLRHAADAADADFVSPERAGEAVFEVEASTFPGRQFGYQLGWAVGGAALTIWEPWAEVR